MQHAPAAATVACLGLQAPAGAAAGADACWHRQQPPARAVVVFIFVVWWLLACVPAHRAGAVPACRFVCIAAAQLQPQVQ